MVEDKDDTANEVEGMRCSVGLLLLSLLLSFSGWLYKSVAVLVFETSDTIEEDEIDGEDEDVVVLFVVESDFLPLRCLAS